MRAVQRLKQIRESQQRVGCEAYFHSPRTESKCKPYILVWSLGKKMGVCFVPSIKTLIPCTAVMLPWHTAILPGWQVEVRKPH